MKKFNDLKLFYYANGVRYPMDRKKPTALIYFGENSSLVENYPKLKIMRQDMRYVMVPTTRIPRTRITSNDKLEYKSIGLHGISDLQKIPSGQNIIVDLSGYIKALDLRYKPVHYRQRAGMLLKAMVIKAYMLVPEHYHKILVYAVDKTKPKNKYINTKFFPFLQLIKDGDLRYTDILYALINDQNTEYRLFMKDGKTNLSRVINYLKKSDSGKLSEEIDKEYEKTADKILKKIPDLKKYDKEKRETIKKAVAEYLKKNNESMEQYEVDIPMDEAIKIVTVAVLTNVSGDIKTSKTIINKTKINPKAILNTVIDRYIDEILPKEHAQSSSTNVQIQEMDVVNIIEDKSPEHIFKYRQKNIKTNLKNDLLNTFKVLETREGGLKVEDLEFVDKSSPPGEMLKSDVTTVVVTLRDENGKKHTAKIDIPKINEQGVFTVNGKTKCLINQIVQLPITFPKKNDSKFESSYGAFHIVSKKERAKDYLQIFIGSYKLPLFVVMASRFGFDHICKLFDIKYNIEEKNRTDVEYKIKVENKKYIYFLNIDSILKKELINSLLKVKISTMNIDKLFESPDYFNEVILKLTGRVNSVYRIQSSFDNIVDPISKQILLNKQLPTALDLIMKYMASKVIEGYVIQRNDITNQRIRNSEVIAQLVQQQVHTAYTIYKEQLLSGNTKAKFTLPQTKVLTEFVNSEIVANMEYANPIEEMSVMTRISPSGSNIGGIPDKGAITKSGRDVNDSFFGNIDPLDTPEGGNIGIIQHLSVDAVITSTRGMFQQKKISDSEHAGVLSTSTALIPFVAYDDGTRVMFGANQARQSLPLKKPEPPLIQSGYESILTKNLSDNFIKKSNCDGKVISVTPTNIKIKCKDGKTSTISTKEKQLISGSGKNTLSIFKPIVSVGDIVKTDNIIAEGSCVSQGAISVGKTLCTAVMSYKGFNFEDGIVVSERLVKSEKLTSLHGITEEIQVDEKDKIIFLAKPGGFIKKGEQIFRKIIGDVSELLGYSDDDEDSLGEISGGQYIKKSPGGKLVDIEVYSNIPITENLKLLKDYAIKTRKKYNMTDEDDFKIKKEKIKGIVVKLIIEQEMPLGVGDKLSNRHGAKGIVSLIEKDEFMPITPWGERVEIIVNPIGIINRMNVGQLYELYAGLISKTLGRKIVELKSKPKIIELLKTVLPLLDKTKNKLLSTTFITRLSKLPQAKFNMFIAQTEKNKGFTLIIPPFQEPKKEDLSKVLKILGLKAAYNVKLQEFEIETKQPVPLGYMYFEKLEHIATDKMAVRSTGPITGKTGQPTAGKKREGGQRMGEMDVYSLLSYNAKTVLAEMFGPLSDDTLAKNEYISNIVKNGNTPFISSGHTNSKDLLNNYMVALMLTKG